MQSNKLVRLLAARRSAMIGVTLVLLLAAGLSVLLMRPADAAIGNGGTPASGVGGAQSEYGWGWHKFAVGSNGVGTKGGPGGFRDGTTTWTGSRGVQQACINDNAKSAIMFTVRTSNKKINSAYIYRYVKGNYPTGWDNLSNRQSGGNWLSTKKAGDAFKELPAADKKGFSFGTNVAWFCHDYLEWQIGGTSSANKSEIRRRGYGKEADQTVTFTHKLKNTGTDNSGKKIKSTVGYNYAGGGWKTHHHDNTKHDAVINKGATRTVSPKSRRVNAGAKAGDKYCQRITFNNQTRTKTGNTNSTQACATVLSEWKIGHKSTADKSTVRRQGHGTAAQQTVKFTHELKNSGPDTSASVNSKVQYKYGSGSWTDHPDANAKANATIANTKTRTPSKSKRVDASAKAGEKYCQRITYSNQSRDKSGNSSSGEACATVLTEWDITHNNSTASSSLVVPGGRVNFTHSIKNNGPDRSDEVTYYIVSRTKKAGGTSGWVRAVSSTNRKAQVNHKATATHPARTVNVSSMGIGANEQYCEAIRYSRKNRDTNATTFSNPAGEVCVKMSNPDWNIIGASSVAPNTVSRSNPNPAANPSTTFTHTLTNDGSATSGSVSSYVVSRVKNADGSVKRDWQKVGSTDRSGVIGVGSAANRPGARSVSINVGPNEQYCEAVRFTRKNRAASATAYNGTSAEVCVRMVPKWSITPKVTADYSRTKPAKPNDTITWKHWFENAGPDTTTTSVDYQAMNGSSRVGAVRSQSSVARNGKSAEFSTTHGVTQDDVGKELCRTTRVARRSDNNANALDASAHCVNVPYNYRLEPRITVPGAEGDVLSGDPNDMITEARGVIENNGGPTKSHTNIEWKLTQAVYEPGEQPVNRGGGRDERLPCVFFGRIPESPKCKDLSDGSTGSSGSIGKNGRRDVSGEPSYDGVLGVGSKLCFALSVKRNASGSAPDDLGWRHSELRCLVVGKYPKVQIHGGNLIARSNVEATTTRSSSKEFGSWAEYGILARGNIAFMASASGLALGHGNSEQSAWSPLTFTKVTDVSLEGVKYGKYTRLSTGNKKASIQAAFPGGKAVSSPVSANDLQGIVTNAATLTVNGGELGKGRWAVLHGQNVEINGNITYTDDSLGDVSQIPQLVIIANNITINGNVDRVDAWLVADNIATCHIHSISSLAHTYQGQKLDYRDCDKRLTVNGPVIADKLYLRRTAGAEVSAGSMPPDTKEPLPSGPGAPAEVFNMRPDAYMWMHYRVNAMNMYRTTNAKELPPRY